MPLLDHLREARTRALRAGIGLVLGAVVGWLVYPRLFAVLQQPVLRLADERDAQAVINFAGVAASLDVQITVSLFAGVILSSPWWITQLWGFVTPGLTRTERRYTAGFVAVAVPLFLAGTALAWLIMPTAVRILTSFTPTGAANIIDAQDYLGFVMRLVLAFGLAFLLPVVMVGLTLAGLVPARTWVGGWRWAVLASGLFSAVATPTGDAWSMLALMVPMLVLYALAAGVGLVVERRRRRR